MTRYFAFLSFVFFICTAAFSQNLYITKDSIVKTSHEITVGNQKITYEAQTGFQPVWNEEGKPIASVHYTYYKRTNGETTETRPLLISFNGGPGSASVWMHMAYTGPYLLHIDEEGYPLQPYGVKENPHSVLDCADLLYVNPVNTGYSRMAHKEVDRKLFFGVNADIEYLSRWIGTFVTRENRWRSPKFLIGESYGTTRVSGLAHALQNKEWMYLNGVILVSPTNIGIAREGIVQSANRIPYFTAAAWYHSKLPASLQNEDLLDVLEESEKFTVEEFLPALAKGAFLELDRKEEIATKLEELTGIEKQIYLDYNLELPTSAFWKLLLKREGFTVGRLDSRYLGIDRVEGGDSPDYNAELMSWLHSFTPAVNYYFKNYLNFSTDLKYNMFGPVHPWDRQNDRTGEQLRQAMAQNPYLKVMIQAGYFDGATNYFDAKYSMWHLDPSGKMSDRLRFEGYRSGHMMYLRKEDLAASTQHIRSFILSSLPTKDQPAKY
jgi:carboxypeptidase C (cathepsin A)